MRTSPVGRTRRTLVESTNVPVTPPRQAKRSCAPWLRVMLRPPRRGGSARSSRLKRSGSSRCGTWPTPSYQERRRSGRRRGCARPSPGARPRRPVPASRAPAPRARAARRRCRARGPRGLRGSRLATTFQHTAVQLVVRHRLHDARAHEGAHGADVRRQIIRGGVDEMVEKTGARSAPKAASPTLTVPSTKLIAAIRSWP